MRISATMRKSFSNLKGLSLSPGDRVTILNVSEHATTFINESGEVGMVYTKELLDYFEAWWK